MFKLKEIKNNNNRKKSCNKLTMQGQPINWTIIELLAWHSIKTNSSTIIILQESSQFMWYIAKYLCNMLAYKIHNKWSDDLFRNLRIKDVNYLHTFESFVFKWNFIIIQMLHNYYFAGKQPIEYNWFCKVIK
jgi:hypothetical protein